MAETLQVVLEYRGELDPEEYTAYEEAVAAALGTVKSQHNQIVQQKRKSDWKKITAMFDLDPARETRSKEEIKALVTEAFVKASGSNVEWYRVWIDGYGYPDEEPSGVRLEDIVLPEL